MVLKELPGSGMIMVGDKVSLMTAASEQPFILRGYP